ncbi:MAG: hypothetical protein IJS86_03340 [Lachnospiraceae bacterium]|nr:hypothetical protein [Lachnospiraceae bacterium]
MNKCQIIAAAVFVSEAAAFDRKSIYIIKTLAIIKTTSYKFKGFDLG